MTSEEVFLSTLKGIVLAAAYFCGTGLGPAIISTGELNCGVRDGIGCGLSVCATKTMPFKF